MIGGKFCGGEEAAGPFDGLGLHLFVRSPEVKADHLVSGKLALDKTIDIGRNCRVNPPVGVEEAMGPFDRHGCGVARCEARLLNVAYLQCLGVKAASCVRPLGLSFFEKVMKPIPAWSFGVGRAGQANPRAQTSL